MFTLKETELMKVFPFGKTKKLQNFYGTTDVLLHAHFSFTKVHLNTSTFVLFILQIKISELQYIALFVVSGSIKKQFLNLLCQYLSLSLFFQ